MRRTCARVVAWLVVGASAAGCGGNPPPKPSAGGGKPAPTDLELAPGAAGGEKGKAPAPHQEHQRPRVD